MSIQMSARKATLTCVLAAATALSGGAAFADSHDHCRGDHCRYSHHDDHRGHYDHHGRRVVVHDGRRVVIHENRHVIVRHREPTIVLRRGERIHGGRIIEAHRYHRLPPLRHRYEHYRVIDNRVVLVNDNTLQVLAVVGLASVLLSN